MSAGILGEVDANAMRAGLRASTPITPAQSFLRSRRMNRSGHARTGCGAAARLTPGSGQIHFSPFTRDIGGARGKHYVAGGRNDDIYPCIKGVRVKIEPF